MERAVRLAHAAGVQAGRAAALEENRQAVVAALARFQEFLRVPLENALAARRRIDGVVKRNSNATAAEVRVDLELGIYSLVEMTEKLLAGKPGRPITSTSGGALENAPTQSSAPDLE